MLAGQPASLKVPSLALATNSSMRALSSSSVSVSDDSLALSASDVTYGGKNRVKVSVKAVSKIIITTSVLYRQNKYF